MKNIFIFGGTKTFQPAPNCHQRVYVSESARVLFYPLVLISQPGRCYIALQWVQPFINSGHYSLRDGVPLLISVRWFQLLNASPPSRVRRWGHWIVPERLNNTVSAWSFQYDLNARLLPYQASPLPTEVLEQDSPWLTY